MKVHSRVSTLIILFILACSAFILFNRNVFSQAEPVPLQPLIDQAKPGDRLSLQPGTYEGPVVIDKSIHLDGQGKVNIRSQGDSPVINVRADQVEITGIELIDERAGKENASILLESSDNRLNRIVIRTRGSGVVLREAHRNELSEIRIAGLMSESEKSFSLRGNGFDLWGSHDNKISLCSISNMQDGIYMESSESNRMERNYVSDSRYGYHMMFTKDIFIVNNDGERNVTGAMIMGAEQTQVLNNRFIKQSENVNSQGLLLYEANRTVVSGNHMEGNRVGVYMELSSGNQIHSNAIVQNFIGLQFIQAENNAVTYNRFISNVVQAQAKQSTNNEIKENYWDDAEKIDMQGDGKSDLAYRVNPFFLKLTDSVPPFQLFFRSPGMIFLEGLFQDQAEEWMKDDSPLMHPATDVRLIETGRLPILMLLMSIFLLAVSMYSILWGALKK